MCTDKKLIERELRKRKSERMINVSIEWSVCFVDRFECDTSIHSLQTQQKKSELIDFCAWSEKKLFFRKSYAICISAPKAFASVGLSVFAHSFRIFLYLFSTIFRRHNGEQEVKIKQKNRSKRFYFSLLNCSYFLSLIADFVFAEIAFWKWYWMWKGDVWRLGSALVLENHTSLSLFTWIGVLFVCEIVVIFAVVHSLIFTTFRRPRRVFTFFCRNCENTAHYSSFFFCSAYLVLLLFVVVLFCWYSLLVFLYSFHFHSIVMCTHLHFEHEKSISKYLLRMYYCLNVICFYLSLPLSLSFVFLFACDVANTRLLR